MKTLTLTGIRYSNYCTNILIKKFEHLPKFNSAAKHTGYMIRAIKIDATTKKNHYIFFHI